MSIIADPNIVYILLLLGIYGLIFEFASPGYMLPGIIGTISLLLALYALQFLPINYGSFALMLFGITLLIAEIFVPSFGAIGMSGVIAFVIGSVLLLDNKPNDPSLSWTLIAVMAVVNTIFFLVIISMAIKARRRKIVSGQEEMLGMIGEALEDFKKQDSNEQGWVRMHGETWRAKALTPIKKGDLVQVIKIEGLILVIQQINHGEL